MYVCIYIYICMYVYIYIYIYVYTCVCICVFANFADNGEHSLAEASVYYTRLAEPIGKLWATNPRSPQGLLSRNPNSNNTISIHINNSKTKQTRKLNKLNNSKTNSTATNTDKHIHTDTSWKPSSLSALPPWGDSKQ